MQLSPGVGMCIGQHSIFAPDSPLTLKRVTKVSLWLMAYPSRFYIDIRLRHGRREGDVEVSFPNRAWVAATLTQIDETTKSFAPQDSFFLRHPLLAKFVIAYGISLTFPTSLGYY